MAYTRDISRALKISNETTLALGELPATSAMTIDSSGLAVMRPGSPIQMSARSYVEIHDASGDVFVLPTYSIASKMIDRYFSEWGSFWPYINEASFRETLDHIYQGTSTVPRVWLGLLNMAFALVIQRSFTSSVDVNTSSQSYRYYIRATEIVDTHTLTCATLETGKFKHITAV